MQNRNINPQLLEEIVTRAPEINSNGPNIDQLINQPLRSIWPIVYLIEGVLWVTSHHLTQTTNRTNMRSIQTADGILIQT